MHTTALLTLSLQAMHEHTTVQGCRAVIRLLRYGPSLPEFISRLEE